VDWTAIRRGRNKLSAFVGTLGFSRLSFVWFADNERFDALIEAHERFFDALGGVPHTILFDKMKTVLIDRNAYGPGLHRFNEGFRDFAKHHGFGPRMCAPYRAQADLDAWLIHYNTERPHLGYRNMGRRPIETVMSFVSQEG